MNPTPVTARPYPPVPRYQELRPELPAPIYDERPGWVELYWKAWELAFRNFHNPAPGSALVAPFIDAAFNENIFLWDSCFMSMFCDVAFPLVPGIGTLDNFYARQHDDGEISREINRETGIDFAHWQNKEDLPLFSRWGYDVRKRQKPVPVAYIGRLAPTPNPRLTLDALNHPLPAWSELEHYRWTADRERLAKVWAPLLRYYQALEQYLRQGNGLYVTDWASMDNSPRNPYLEGGGVGTDISCEMVLFARQLGEMATILGRNDEAQALKSQAEALAFRINELMWSGERRFYFDLTRDGRQAPVRTIAGYWALLAGVASPAQARCLVEELSNPATFGRRNPVPTCAADEPGYRSHGGYWRGGVWAPTNTMVIRGLERYGHEELARQIALRHLDLVAEVHASTGTIWESYAPDFPKPGAVVKGVNVRGDFVGWSGIGPILYLLEHAIGLRVTAPESFLRWQIGTEQRCGCERFRFGGRVVNLLAQRPDSSGDRRISVDSDGPFTLEASWRGRRRSFHVERGRAELVL